jgi:hypothetical protein
MIRALLLLAVLLIAGCDNIGQTTDQAQLPTVETDLAKSEQARRRAEEERTAAVKTSKDAIAARQEALDKQHAAEQLAAQYGAEAAALAKKAAELREQEIAGAIRRWSVGAIVAGLLAAAVGAFLWLKLGLAKTGGCLLIGGLASAACGLAGLWLAAWWLLIARSLAALVCLALLAAVAWTIRRLVLTAREGAAHGDRLEDAVLRAGNELGAEASERISWAIAQAKDMSSKAQDALRLRTLVAKVRRKPLRLGPLGEGTGHSQ